MVKSKRSKRSKASSKGGIDRISNLPEPLISHILSLLPTKCAVATSVLSTRWNLLWTSISNLDFNSYEGNEYSTKALAMKRTKFTHFVNRVLLLLNPPIQNFRLDCIHGQFDPSYLNSWLCFAFRHTVQQLAIILKLNEPVQLPPSHIHCNVVDLKLQGHMHYTIPAAASVCFLRLQSLYLYRITFSIPSNSSVSFPNLKNLHLNCVRYANEESVHKILSCCPVLDDLVIEREFSDNVPCLIIRIPSLTRLRLDFRDMNDSRYKLQIDTPALQYLHLEDDLPCEYLPAENLSSLLQAKVTLKFGYDDNFDLEDINAATRISISKLIESLTEVKFLSVSDRVLTAIVASANISSSFHKLTRLELEVTDCLDFPVVMNKFLESMDNLEQLVIEGWNEDCSHQSWWTEPLNVPKCLLSRVTTISFSCVIVDCCDQLAMLRYFLKTAEVLQLLTISTRFYPDEKYYSEKKYELLQKIAMFPRGSRTCQLAFT